MNRPHSTLRAEQGFTLVEIIIVCVLLAVLSGILYGSINGIIRTKNFIESRRAADRTGTYVIARITRELMGQSELNAMGVPDSESDEEGDELDDEVDTCSDTDFPKLQGRNGKSGDFDTDQINFVSSTGAQAMQSGMSNSGAVEIHYRLEEDPDAKDLPLPAGLKRSDGLKRMVLIREEFPACTLSKRMYEKRRIVFPIASNVVSLNFRYLQRNMRWRVDWTQDDTGSPQAVEVSLKVLSDSGEIQTFKTAVALLVKKGSGS